MLAAVGAVRDAEAKVKVEDLELLVAEEVSLNHAEFADRLAAHAELDSFK